MAKVLELQFTSSPSDEYSGLISFRIDWFDLLVVQGTLKSLLQHHISKPSPCCPRDSQESFPAPHFKTINSWVLSFLYCPTFTSIHDYWKNHSFDCPDFCQQSDVTSMEVSLSKLWKIVKDREARRASVHGLQRVRHDLATEQQQSHTCVSASLLPLTKCNHFYLFKLIIFIVTSFFSKWYYWNASSWFLSLGHVLLSPYEKGEDLVFFLPFCLHPMKTI